MTTTNPPDPGGEVILARLTLPMNVDDFADALEHIAAHNPDARLTKDPHTGDLLILGHPAPEDPPVIVDAVTLIPAAEGGIEVNLGTPTIETTHGDSDAVTQARNNGPHVDPDLLF